MLLVLELIVLSFSFIDIDVLAAQLVRFGTALALSFSSTRTLRYGSGSLLFGSITHWTGSHFGISIIDLGLQQLYFEVCLKAQNPVNYIDSVSGFLIIFIMI